MYAEECSESLVNGEKVNIRGVGTIRPNISEYARCGLPTIKDKEESHYTVVRIRVHTSDILREKLKERLSRNAERGIVGLEGEKEWPEE